MWDNLVGDFGGSMGAYAMEAAAYARFQKLAQQHNVSFEAEAYDRGGSLMVVQIIGTAGDRGQQDTCLTRFDRVDHGIFRIRENTGNGDLTLVLAAAEGSRELQKAIG